MLFIYSSFLIFFRSWGIFVKQRVIPTFLKSKKLKNRLEFPKINNRRKREGYYFSFFSFIPSALSWNEGTLLNALCQILNDGGALSWRNATWSLQKLSTSPKQFHHNLYIIHYESYLISSYTTPCLQDLSLYQNCQSHLDVFTLDTKTETPSQLFEKTDLVCSISCKECNSVYIGETPY